MISLSGQTVFITGGSRGIGAACVRLFARAGADVAFTYSTAAKEAHAIEKEITNVKVKSYQFDLLNETDASELISKILIDFGKIDVLVNNAGIWEKGEADKMTIADWERTIKINLTGMFVITRAVLPVMKKNSYGRIINISSTAGQRGEAAYSHYAASKGGMISFTKSLAAEFGKFNINTNSVAPGWVISDMTEEVFSDEDYKESVRLNIPVNRIAGADDIAGPVLFLASELSKHINGEILNVNGGSVLCG